MDFFSIMAAELKSEHRRERPAPKLSHIQRVKFSEYLEEAINGAPMDNADTVPEFLGAEARAKILGGRENLSNGRGIDGNLERS